MTLNIAIFEDEPVFADVVEELVRAWSLESGRLVDIERFTEGAQMTQVLAERCDILFLDIGLPGADGMTVAAQVRAFGTQVPIVFVTGHQEYVYDGYRVEAFRFLQKPVEKADVYECMERAQKYHDLCRAEYLTLRLRSGIVRIQTDDIIYIEVQQHHCSLVTVRGTQKYLITLSELLARLPNNDLLQCHRSYVVNCRHVHSVDGSHILLDNKKIVPVSRTYAGPILKRIARLMEE